MNNTIYERAFARLKMGDLLYYLGDLSFNKQDAELFFQAMKHAGVQVHCIFGNHDYNIKKIIKNKAVWSGDLKTIKIQNQSITLCHYQMRVWPKSHFNSWLLYGHSHGTLDNVGKMLDVGVDANNFNIWSFDDIKSFMANQPDNFNLVKEKR